MFIRLLFVFLIINIILFIQPRRQKRLADVDDDDDALLLFNYNLMTTPFLGNGICCVDRILDDKLEFIFLPFPNSSQFDHAEKT